MHQSADRRRRSENDPSQRGRRDGRGGRVGHGRSARRRRRAARLPRPAARRRRQRRRRRRQDLGGRRDQAPGAGGVGQLDGDEDGETGGRNAGRPGRRAHVDAFAATEQPRRRGGLHLVRADFDEFTVAGGAAGRRRQVAVRGRLGVSDAERVSVLLLVHLLPSPAICQSLHAGAPAVGRAVAVRPPRHPASRRQARQRGQTARARPDDPHVLFRPARAPGIAHLLFPIICGSSMFCFSFFSARCNIYISRLCYDVSVRLYVRLSVTEVHWRIIANLGFKFRSQFTAHCGRGACGRE